MTGPEHYREAEKLIGQAENFRIEANGDWRDDATSHQVADALVARAQVHATLALAAATALTGYLPTEAGTTDEISWTRAANNGMGVLA
jgi:hypothetical protein